MIHVSGSRLIHCGVDGLYYGDLQLEKLNEDIYLCLPVDHEPFSHSPTLLTWIKSCISDSFLLAEPSDWFSRAQQTHSTSVSSQSELWVWYFFPAAALDALEELVNGCLKRHEILWGIVIIPVVMQHDWFKRFVKVTYIYLFIPAGSIPEWPANMHEVLTIGLYFPLLRHQPRDWSQV